MLSGTIFISFAVKGIRDFRMSRMSGIEISSSRGLKKTLKLALGMKRLTSRGPTALGRVSFTSRGLIFGGFFNPWDEEISIPDIRLIRKSLIYYTKDESQKGATNSAP